MTTDTPLDACPHCGAEARVNQNDTYYCGSWRISTGGVSRTDQCRALERAEKAETEVERLRASLRRAIEIAEKALKGACGEWGCIGKSDEEDKLLAELDQLKATLNHDKK